MIIVMAVVAIALIVGGIFVYHYCGSFSDGLEVLGGIMTVIGIIALIVCLIAGIVLTALVVKDRVYDEEIAMRTENNAEIEERLMNAVELYMAQEENSIKYVTDAKKSSAVELVTLYPELNSDKLISSMMDTYAENNKIIMELKTSKLHTTLYRWWLYFGS